VDSKHVYDLLVEKDDEVENLEDFLKEDLKDEEEFQD
jgi:hypothetical protein